MLSFSKYYIIVLIILGLFFQLGCATRIKRILKKPEQFNNKKVKIKGKVISALELEGFRAFTVKDHSGKIYVITESFLPVLGDKVKVKGKVSSKFYFQRITMPVIIEKVRSANDSIPVPPVNE